MAPTLHRNFSAPSFIAYSQNFPSIEPISPTTHNHDSLNWPLTQPDSGGIVSDTVRASTSNDEPHRQVAITFATEIVTPSSLSLAQPESPRKRGLATRFKQKLNSLRFRRSKKPTISSPLKDSVNGENKSTVSKVSECPTPLTEQNDQQHNSGLYIHKDPSVPIVDMSSEGGESSQCGAGEPITNTTVDGNLSPVHGFKRQYEVIGTSSSDSSGGRPLVGEWQCCHCAETQSLREHVYGMHIVGVLSCTCPHRSCENCVLTGKLRAYKPAQDPDTVPASERNPKEVRFGVVCGNCGLSWRVQVVKPSLSSRIAAIPRRFRSFEKLRPSKPMANFHGDDGNKLRSAKSVVNLRALSNEMEKEHGEQAPGIVVKFNGIKCTCGKTLNDSSLCFQIIDTPGPVPGAEPEGEAEPEILPRKEPTFMATREDIERGIGTNVLSFNKNGTRIPHFNPLMCHPVADEELGYLGCPRNSGNHGPSKTQGKMPQE